MTMGAFDPEGLQAQAEARYEFLKAIRACELEDPSLIALPGSAQARSCRALADLRDRPLRMFRMLHDCSPSGMSFDLLRWDTFTDSGWNEVFSKGSLAQNGALLGLRPIQNITPRQYEAMQRMRKVVTDWARVWNLNNWENNDSWFLEHVLSTLYQWHAYPASCDSLDWALVTLPIRSLEVAKTRFALEFRTDADLALETRNEAKARFKNDLKAFNKTAEAEFERHLDSLERQEKERNADKPKAKRAKRRKVSPYEMLVRFQLQNWKQEEIREHYQYANLSDVGHLIPKHARQLGLILREKLKPLHQQ
jgi:hypothetical protein